MRARSINYAWLKWLSKWQGRSTVRLLLFLYFSRLEHDSFAIFLFTDPQVHLAFLTSLLSRIDTKTSKEAHVLLLASIAHAKLLYGDLEGTKSDMDAAWKILDTLEGVDNGVNAAYYNVGANYYKVSTFYSSLY